MGSVRRGRGLRLPLKICQLPCFFLNLMTLPDGVSSPWHVPPPATQNMAFALFSLNLMTLHIRVRLLLQMVGVTTNHGEKRHMTRQKTFQPRRKKTHLSMSFVLCLMSIVYPFRSVAYYLISHISYLTSSSHLTHIPQNQNLALRTEFKY